MPVTAIVGAQWGDEGKGKITDILAQNADLVMRFGGGANAGHTVVNELGDFKLHLIPSGIFNPRAVSLIGTGALIDFDALTVEASDLERQNVSIDSLRISSRSHIVMPYHVLLDRLNDESRGSQAIGTTRRGVGPAYVDRADRIGIQAGDLLDESVLERKLRFVLQRKNQVLEHVFHVEPLAIADLLERAHEWRERYADLIVDQVKLVTDALAAGKRILLEGQLGAMRDLDWGTYPYVTSSTTIAGGGAVGGGIPATRIDSVLGVVKAYTTAVGAGPLPTELTDAFGDELRERGGEYGATTGRPRRVGWFDAVAARYACSLNGFTGLAVTKLDVLDELPSLRICTAYTINGVRYDTVPVTALYEHAVPVYEELPGWQESTTTAKSWEDLPQNASAYLQRIERQVGAPIEIVSVGKDRQETIIGSRKPQLTQR